MTQIPGDITPQIITRLKKVQGQLGGVVRMIEEGRDCEELVTQLAAASKALNRAGFTIVSQGLKECVKSGDSSGIHEKKLEKMFLALA